MTHPVGIINRRNILNQRERRTRVDIRALPSHWSTSVTLLNPTIIWNTAGNQSVTVAGLPYNFIEFDGFNPITSVATEVPPVTPAGLPKNLGIGEIVETGARVYVCLLAQDGGGTNFFDWPTSIPDDTRIASISQVSIPAVDTGNDVTLYLPNRF